MRALLDTQAFLWANQAPQRLGAQLDLVADPANDVLVSAVVSWELAIKTAIGRLDLPEPVATYVPARLAITGFRSLAIEHAHALAVAGLPLHHRDPFDRLLIAQATVLDLPVITSDPMFDAYGIQVLRTA